uniref:Uncharacterized protein n=1 Tax=Oryza glumipatula TaxID=40148 RepID=A0A0E0AK75_9ORYZ
MPTGSVHTLPPCFSNHLRNPCLFALLHWTTDCQKLGCLAHWISYCQNQLVLHHPVFSEAFHQKTEK